MTIRLIILLTCLLATSVLSSDLDSGYDPGSHGSDNEEDGFGVRESLDRNRGNNEWTPMIGPGPSGNDAIIHHGDGEKTLIAGSPTSPIAEAINYYGPPPPPPQVPVGYGIDYNQIPHPVRIPGPRPYKVYHHHKKAPYEVRTPVRVPVPRPIPVPVPRPVQVPVDKPYEVIVERKVPYEVRVPVQVPVQVPYHVDVPQPYPVPVVVPKPIIIKHPVPVAIKYIASGGRKGLLG